jgi:hypothetical protein
MIGHDDIANQGVYNRSEGDPDDHANGEIDHVAAHGKFFEFVEHGQPQSLADFSSLENLVWFRAASLGSLAGMAKADEVLE